MPASDSGPRRRVRLFVLERKTLYLSISRRFRGSFPELASATWFGMNFHGSDDAAVAGWLAEVWSETAKGLGFVCANASAEQTTSAAARRRVRVMGTLLSRIIAPYPKMEARVSFVKLSV
jgi:hypothetical protein